MSGGRDRPARAAGSSRDDVPLPRPVPSKKPRSQFRKPPLRLFSTTLWEYPSQHYGETMQGDKRYVGATPSWVIWQCLQRWTREGDLVIDPMCGSGTTLDVARDLGRRALGFDVAPSRPGIMRADARRLPVEDGKAGFVFVDPPYSTHVKYSDDPACIGRLDAGADESRRENEYFASMRRVIEEMHRVLRRGGHAAVYVSDSVSGSARGGRFMPIGFRLFAMMCERFEPVEVIAVVRRNAKLGQGNYRRAADEGGFMMRGFNYLFVARRA